MYEIADGDYDYSIAARKKITGAVRKGPGEPYDLRIKRGVMAVHLGASREHGFDEPLELLSDCHRRIERFLQIQRKVAEEAGDGSLGGEHRRAAEAALEYFKTAAPRHTADEEQSLFPMLRESAEPGAREALDVMQALEKDHEAAEAAHAQANELFRQWLDSGSLTESQRTKLMALLDELIRLYEPHIKMEDTRLFPLAAEALSREQIQRLGDEMAGRRGLPAQRHGKTSGNPSKLSEL
jgi:hemerythrin-like domain-containing protein